MCGCHEGFELGSVTQVGLQSPALPVAGTPSGLYPQGTITWEGRQQG